MAPKQMTLRATREWASTAFPDDFARFDTYIKTASLTFSCVRVELDGGLSAYKVDFVEVGSTHADNELIFSWKGTKGVDVGHKNGEGNVQPHQDLTNPLIKFTAPFCWLKPTENEVGIARFEMLVRYLTLSRVTQKSVLRHNIDSFKEHFPGACRDIAEHAASRSTQTPVRTRAETPSQARVPTLIYQTPTRMPSQTQTDTPARSSQAPQSKSASVPSTCTSTDISL